MAPYMDRLTTASAGLGSQKNASLMCFASIALLGVIISASPSDVVISPSPSTIKDGVGAHSGIIENPDQNAVSFTVLLEEKMALPCSLVLSKILISVATVALFN